MQAMTKSCSSIYLHIDAVDTQSTQAYEVFYLQFFLRKGERNILNPHPRELRWALAITSFIARTDLEAPTADESFTSLTCAKVGTALNAADTPYALFVGIALILASDDRAH